MPAAGEPQVFRESYVHSIAALGYPGARRAFQVGPGAVVSNGEVALAWDLGSGGGAVTVSPVYFERDGVPVAHWTVADSLHLVTFEAAAAPARALGDTALMLSVRVEVTRRAPGSGPCEILARLSTRQPDPHHLPWDAPAPAGRRLAWSGRAVLLDGLVAAGVDGAAAPEPGAQEASGAPPHGALLTARCVARLATGERRAWTFWMPLYRSGLPPQSLAGAAAHARVAGDSRRLWRGWLGRATRLETPDTLANAAWRAALVTLIQCHERDGGRWVPIGNPFQYRDVWLRDGARVVRALAVGGLAELALDDARTFTRFQLPSGALLSQRGQLDGTGQALWAMDQATALPPAPDAARELLRFAVSGRHWIEAQRTATRELKLPWAGLLPFGDPRDAELVRAQLVGNDAWAIAGEAAVASLAARAGEQALAREALAAHADYRAAFLAALARIRHADIPPSWQGPGRDWGNAAVGYPTRALPADDPRLAALARRMTAEAGGTGLVRYGPRDSLHTYLGADLAQWALLAGRPEIARRWLGDLLSHSSSTLGQAEIVHRDGGFGANMPPHSTAAAVIVDVLRNMVASDTRDTLELALGGAAEWWNGTRLLGAPTRFGTLDVTLERPADDVLRARFGTVRVPVRVRVPDGMRATAALTEGARVVDGVWVEGAGERGEIAFRVVPVAGGRR
ncbi:MAG: hypothetical protein A2W00_10400 [Candidatus Eisenbacteria bacterium RBG_16_71_46]|nr:MAG: hypothetical protein A2W00_10400 [Candidatus Eisenbacteria bacterium RBG_16_71_46]